MATGRVGLRTHTIRVARIQPAPPGLIFHYEVDLDEVKNRNDTITLETEDGGWRQTIAFKDLQEFEPNWVALEFTGVPMEGTFDLVHDPLDENNEPFLVFAGLSYQQLRQPIEPEDTMEFEEDDDDFSMFDDE